MDPAPVTIEELARFLFKKGEGVRPNCNVSGGVSLTACRRFVLRLRFPIALVRPCVASLLCLCVLAAVFLLWNVSVRLRGAPFVHCARRKLQLAISRRLPRRRVPRFVCFGWLKP